MSILGAQLNDPVGLGGGEVLLGGIALLGGVLIMVGLLGSRKAAEEWADSSSTHEASIVVMIFVAPLYWLLKKIEKKQ